MNPKIARYAIIFFVLLAGGASVTLIVPAILSAKGAALPKDIEQPMAGFTGICLALMITLGGAVVEYAAQCLPMPRRRRWALHGVWLFSLFTSVFLAAAYMMSQDEGVPLKEILSFEFILANPLYTLYCILIPLAADLLLPFVVTIWAWQRSHETEVKTKETESKAAKATIGGAELLHLLGDCELTAREIQEATGLSDYQVRDRLKKLERKGLIQHDGGNPRRYSEVEAA